MSFQSIVRGAVAALALCIALDASAAVGLIQFVAGDVKIRNAAGQVRAAVKGGNVDEGDTLLTAPSSSAQLKMSDGGIVAVRPETELKVDTYRYSGKEDGTERAVMSLAKGGFRTITGLIGRTNKQNYTINTPTATIGIRGTDHEPVVIPIPPAAAPGTPPGAPPGPPPGTYDKVNVGAAFIRSPLGEVNIRPNQVGYAPPNQAPQLLPKVPEFFKATPPVRQAQTGQKEEQQKQSSGSSTTQGATQTSSSGEKSDQQSTTQTASSSSSSGSSSSSSSGGSTTTSEVRSVATVDATPSTASTGTTATTTAVVPTTGTVTPVVSTTTTATVAAAPPPVTQTITGTSSTGSSLNLTTQTTTTSSGTITPISTSPTNPTVVSSTYGSLVVSQAPANGKTTELEGLPAGQPQAQTAYVFDSNKALTEIQHTAHATTSAQSLSTSIPDANLKFSDGTAADVYSDSTGTFYIGRQEGGSIRVTDNSGTVPAFTQSLNGSSAHWLIAVQPGLSALPGGVGTISAVQNVVGQAHYTLAAATHPTDRLGNVGTLNTAVFLADFNAQTVTGALNVGFSTTSTTARSSRDAEIFAITSNLPIKRGGFEAIAGTATAPTVFCSSGDCVSTSYRGTIRGLFGSGGGAGVGTGLGLSYSFGPASTQATTFDDLIQGTAVLTNVGSQAPAAGTNATFASSSNVRHDLVYDTFQSGSTSNANVGIARDTLTVTSGQLGGAKTNSNYLFDANGNLIRIYDTPYAVFDHGTNLTSTTTFTAPTPLTNAEVSMGSLTAVASDLYSDATLGVRMGRWKGGTINITDLLTGNGYVEDLGDRSVHWLVRAAPTSLPVSGIYHYSKVAATQPTDTYGNVGTLDRARLEVDFTRSTVSAGLAVTMPSGSSGSFGNQQLTGYFTDAPLTSSGFNVSSNPSDNAANTDNLHVNCRGAGCAANQNYGGRIRGGFTSGSGAANTAEGAYFRYTFVTNYADANSASSQSRTFDDYIDGFVAFKQGADISKPTVDIFGTVASGQTSTKPPADATVIYAYNFMNGSNLETRSEALFSQGGSGYEVDSAGKLLSAKGYFDDDKSIAGSNPAVASPPSSVQVSTSTNNFSIAYGYYVTPTLTGFDRGSSFTRTADTFQWIRGPGIYPFYLSMVTVNPADISSSNTVAYAPLGGVVTNGSGSVGTISSSSLSVNFNSQSVNAAVNGTVPFSSSNVPFSATATNVALESLGSFWAMRNGASQGPTRHNISSLSINGATNAAGISGNIQGSLMGPGLEGAGFVFDIVSSSGPRAMGSVVLGTPTYTNTSNASMPFSGSPLTDYQLGMIASGMNSVGKLTNSSNGVLAGENLYRVDLGAVSPSRTQFLDYQNTNAQSAQWSLVKFDATYPFAYGCSGTVCNGATEINARYALLDATGGGPLPVNSTSIPAPTAKALEAFYDVDTGMRWGRWGGGKINVGDRASGGGTGAVPTYDGTGTTNQIDLTANNWHYLITGVQSGPVVLPVSGTYNYTMIGATLPTSYTPGQTAAVTGVLNSASLTANFTAKTVDVAVNVTMPGNDVWAASANAIKILKDTGFSVEKALSSATSSLNITRNNSATGTAGQIVGGFAGQSGQGAGIAYSLNQGGATGTTVSGVAAFKR